MNPEGVAGTFVWFQWGLTEALGSETPHQEIPDGNTPVPVTAMVEGIRPNQNVYDLLTGIDANLESPEQLAGETLQFTTPTVAARILGEPAVSFVGATSAVMSGELNPENSATRYAFEYGPCENLESCPETSHTALEESSTYGPTPTTIEVTGLNPSTPYSYRLTATNSAGNTTSKTIGHFKTLPAPAVQATTGAASNITTTGAVIAGIVDPGGEPATYSFEIGINHGTATHLGVIASGTTPNSNEPTPLQATLTGLQPNTEYAYRITAHNGTSSSQGETRTFTTQPPPPGPTEPPTTSLLTTPLKPFPPPPPPPTKCKHGTTPKHGKCTKPKHHTKHHKTQNRRK